VNLPDFSASRQIKIALRDFCRRNGDVIRSLPHFADHLQQVIVHLSSLQQHAGFVFTAGFNAAGQITRSNRLRTFTAFISGRDTRRAIQKDNASPSTTQIASATKISERAVS
jgi:hypothetical protein